MVTGYIWNLLRLRCNPDHVLFWSRQHGMRVSPHLG